MINRSHLIPMIALTMVATALMASSDNGVYIDEAGDAVIRRTDAGNDAPLPTEFEPIDLLELRVQGWEPNSPQTDPYSGVTSGGDEDIARIQLIVDGLVAPPGPIGLDGSPYAPYQFGERPIFGYIELDVDDRDDTGGEFMPLAKNRYLANVGRFGQSPYGSISNRMVRDSSEDIDSDFTTYPQFERTGGEFTLALCGCFTPIIISQDGDMDSIFDAGETWIISGRFFERFTAFQPESTMYGGSDFGLFDPVVELQFRHDATEDQTYITLVFPITNYGASQLAGGSTQSVDSDVSNHTSIEEALDDLIYGSDFAQGDLYQLVDHWKGRDREDYFRPRDWKPTALIGTAPTVQDPAALFIWTDTGYGEIIGDLNDDDLSTELDSQIILDAISLLDGGASDGDAKVNGEVAIVNYGPEFDLRDLNGDGVISDDDLIVPVCLADFTGDGVLNFFDISAFLSAFNAGDLISDLTGDGILNFFDVSAFLSAFTTGCP